MATLQQFTTTQLIASLYDNPNAQTFPWNIQGIVGPQNVIVSGSASTKGTSVGSGTSSRTQIK